MNLTESEPGEQLRSGRGSLQGSGSSSAPDAHRTHRDARSGRALIPATFCQHRGRPAAARSHASDRGTRSGSGKDSGHRYPPHVPKAGAMCGERWGAAFTHTRDFLKGGAPMKNEPQQPVFEVVTKQLVEEIAALYYADKKKAQEQQSQTEQQQKNA